MSNLHPMYAVFLTEMNAYNRPPTKRDLQAPIYAIGDLEGMAMQNWERLFTVGMVDINFSIAC